MTFKTEMNISCVNYIDIQLFDSLPDMNSP